MQLSKADAAYIERILREHVPVGGTYWDNERKSTFEICGACQHKGYLAGEKPDHVDHVMELILWRDR